MVNIKNYSQAKQDLFVITMLNHKKNGFYLEIGGSDPVVINNTFLLENQFNWAGLSIEIDENQVKKYNNIRKNHCFLGNALQINFEDFLKKNNAPKQIDYLSLDIEPAKNTFQCLKALPHNEYRFSIITFEHELYKEGPEIKKESQQFLLSLGYQIVVDNVRQNNIGYEDWYIDPAVISKDIWGKYLLSNIEHSNIVF